MKILKIGLRLVLPVVVVGAAVFVLLMWRGFRATSTPRWWEVSLARAMRNSAIPAHERGLKNPWNQTSDAAQKGRDAFLTQCAGCHGIDGSGKTAVGVNLYPRVPDLRAAATQDLSDGELHYIIENGVQLTGMPAWKLARGQVGADGSEVDSWQLVSFVRSLRPLSGVERSQAAAAGWAHYVGSAACEKCHAEIYARWKKTPMANVIRDPKEHPEAVIPDLATNHVAKFKIEQVAFVYGSLWKQRYFTKVGDDYFPLPVQWDVKNKTWRPYMVPATGGDWWGALYPPDNMQRPTGPTCDGCHSVNYNIETRQVSEWNVGCERCHGPGSEHVAHPARGNVLNPGLMDAVAANDTCIQCHSQGQPVKNPIAGKLYDWPVGYNVGGRLADSWKLEDCTLGQQTFYYFPDCTAHKNRMQGNDFAQSVMYGHGITCAACHDVHGTANYAQLRKPAEQICLDCHAAGGPNGPRTATLAAHTHHKEGSAGSQCVACHMPAIETEGVPGTFVHAHTFRFITPAMTERYKIPNPCTSCHADKSTAWAEEAMSHWPERSPWRMQ